VGKMRIDKFMKVSRIIKRRTVANDACSGGRVSINGKVAKPGDKLKVGDVIEISFGDKLLKARVLDLNEHATKETASQMYEIL